MSMNWIRDPGSRGRRCNFRLRGRRRSNDPSAVSCPGSCACSSHGCSMSRSLEDTPGCTESPLLVLKNIQGLVDLCLNGGDVSVFLKGRQCEEWNDHVRMSMIFPSPHPMPLQSPDSEIRTTTFKRRKAISHVMK